MKSYFAYIRVSTVKQGEKGSSLQEQRSAIEAYARRYDLRIDEWFEEQETAAKQGRPVFARMLKALRRSLVSGVITHKIDRSARNLRDWATLGELLDSGLELHFAHEGLDLSSRGGRLSADIQAVVAADFIRNLREETRKGFYGRLKQGLYPLRAPLGYLDQGGGNPKIIDPERGPLIAKAFKLYGTGDWSFETLGAELFRLGLRNRNGRRVTRNGISTLLNNPFYYGLIHIERSNELFDGIHEPLISKGLYDQVQAMLRAHSGRKVKSHTYLFQRTVRCGECRYSLVAERQKGRVYYRCHTPSCPPTCVREDVIRDYLRSASKAFRFTDRELSAAEADLDFKFISDKQALEQDRQALLLSVTSLEDRLSRLTDAYIDRIIDQNSYLERKNRLLEERITLNERRAKLEAGQDGLRRHVQNHLELIKSLGDMPDKTPPAELRQLLKETTSNFLAFGKDLVITWAPPFDELADDDDEPSSDPKRITPRTGERLRRLNTALRAAMTLNNELPDTDVKPVFRKQNPGARNIVQFNERRRRTKRGGMGDIDARAA
jgi:DNA invertase Pin-like site-specific DNA recombinase